MKIKIGDEVVMRGGRIVTVRQQYSSTLFAGARENGANLSSYRLADITGLAGQMNSATPAEWAVECGVRER